MSIKVKENILLICCVLSVLIIMISNVNALDYPTPPPLPKAFDNSEELQKYLNKLHNYYVVVGRPRFGKRAKSNDGLLLALLKNMKSSELNEDYVDANREFYGYDMIHNEGYQVPSTVNRNNYNNEFYRKKR